MGNGLFGVKRIGVVGDGKEGKGSVGCGWERTERVIGEGKGREGKNW